VQYRIVYKKNGLERQSNPVRQPTDDSQDDHQIYRDWCETEEQSMAIECPECGDKHSQLSTFPDQPVTIEMLESLADSDSILYAGPTAINPDGTTPMVALATETKASVVTYFDAHGWVVTFENERDDIDEEYGMLVNEMASQCLEAGYQCVEQWMADGEPGGRVR